MKPPARVPRLGSLDLLLVALAVFAVWTRTPVGGIGQWAWASLAGDAAEQPDLIGFFRSEGPPKTWVDEVVALPVEQGPPTAFPEPWRSAVSHGLPEVLPDATVALLGPGDAPAEDRLLAWLDGHYAEGASVLEPEVLLARAAIEPALHDRAVERARAAGEPSPERFDAYRRYLPEEVEREAGALMDSVMALAVVLDLHWPVDPTLRISSPFGDRVHPVLRTKKFHNGVDLPVAVGTPIHAAQAGVLRAATEDRVSGKYVIVEHAGGVSTTYCHLSVLPSDPVGSVVTKGAWIGDSGNTGRSTGPHLHFILRVDGKAVDPAPYRRVPPAG